MKFTAVFMFLVLLLNVTVMRSDDLNYVPIEGSILYSTNVNSLVNNSARLGIYNYNLQNPGIHFREICNDLSLPVGVVQYHIERLYSHDMIGDYKDRKYRRFFTKKYTGKEKAVISNMRKETTRSILLNLVDGELGHKELAIRLSVTSQALSWHMKNLREADLVQCTKHGTSKEYRLDDDTYHIIEDIIEIQNIF